jgi:hypothetical protein
MKEEEEAQKKLATNFAEFVFWVLNAPNKMTSNSTTTTTTTTTINAKITRQSIGEGCGMA